MKLMRKILLFSLVLTMSVTLLSPAVFAKDTTQISPTSYGVDNLNNEKGTLYVAYLGGSITAGSGGNTNITYKDNAGSGHARWASQLTKRYFQKMYPNKTVVEVNAGVGGTPSDLGLFRMQKDVIDPCGTAGPDVVFVEFAVNDMWSSNSNPTYVHQTMEGIVRQLAHLPKQPVVIFIYTAASRDDGTGFTKYLTSASVHQQVADYYGIGSINLCQYVANGTDIDGNEIVWDKTKSNTWTGDNTHPNDKGYTHYTDYIMKQFQDSPQSYFKKLTWQEIPMSGYEFGKPEAIPFDKAGAVYTGTWAKQTLVGTLGVSNVTTDANATITMNFKGRAFGVYAARGKNGATVSFSVDDKPGSFGNYYASSWMAVATLLNWNTLSPGNHTIKYSVKPSDEKDTFGIGYFFVDQETPDPICYDVKINSNNKLVTQVEPGQRLTGTYSFINSALEEKGTTFQWLVSDTKNGTYTAINGQTGQTWLPSVSDIGKYVKFRVIPKNTEGTTGKAVESGAVKIVRPDAKTCFQAESRITYYKNEQPIQQITADGEITVKATVKNKLSGINSSVSMITTEYQVLESGFKLPIQIKKTTLSVPGGQSLPFAHNITVSAKEDRVVQTMLIADDYLEPICAAVQLSQSTDPIIYVGNDEAADATTSIYQINHFGD